MQMKLSWALLWALVAVFVIIAIVVSIPPVRESIMSFHFLIISGTIFSLLGGALIFWTAKERMDGLQGKFLILTGASAVGIFVSILLHNVIYGLFIYWFGAGFWDRIGLADEPFFFFMAIIICPAAFLIGTVGTMVLAIKRTK